MLNQKSHSLEHELIRRDNSRPSIPGECCHKSASNKLSHIQRRIATLLNVPSDYQILLFNLDHIKRFNVFSCLKLVGNSRCGFLDAGARSSFAINQAKNSHQVEIVGSSRGSDYSYVPKTDWIPFNLSFLHLTSTNETEGNRKTTFPKLKIPLLLDMSSDLFSTKVHINNFSLIYARGNNQIIPDKLCLVIVQNRFLNVAGNQLLTHPGLLRTCGHFPLGVFTSLFLFEHHLRQMEESGGATEHRLRCEKLSAGLYKEIERNTKFCALVNPDDRAVEAVRFAAKNSADRFSFALHLDAKDSNVLTLNIYGDFLVFIEKVPENEITKLISLMQDFELKQL